VLSIASAKPLPVSDIRRLDQWLRELDDAFRSFVRSRRWKIGNVLVDISQGVLLRSTKLIIIAQVEAIFENYGRHCCRKAKKGASVQRLSLADLYYHLGF